MTQLVHFGSLFAMFVDAPNDYSPGVMAGLAAFFWIYMLIIGGILVISLIANWKIAEKAGYSPALSLLMLLPLVNVVVFLIFAFSEWPIEARLRGTVR